MVPNSVVIVNTNTKTIDFENYQTKQIKRENDNCLETVLQEMQIKEEGLGSLWEYLLNFKQGFGQIVAKDKVNKQYWQIEASILNGNQLLATF